MSLPRSEVPSTTQEIPVSAGQGPRRETENGAKRETQSACTTVSRWKEAADMKDKTPIEHAIRDLESRISDLQNGLKDWDSLSVNRSGASVYREKAKRIVLQAQAVESLVRDSVFPYKSLGAK